MPGSVSEPLNNTGEPSDPVYGPPWPAVGATFVTATLLVAVSLAPSSSVTVRVMLKVPSSAYVWLAFWAVDEVPSPKVHA